jgi:hypothetical protein
MPAYNAILYVSGAAALAACLRENRTAPASLLFAPLALVPLVIRVQHAEHRRLIHAAHANPTWWNRGLRPSKGRQ